MQHFPNNDGNGTLEPRPAAEHAFGGMHVALGSKFAVGAAVGVDLSQGLDVSVDGRGGLRS